MRIAVGSFEYEGNSLSLKIDTREDFARKALVFGDAFLPAIEGRSLAVTGGVEVIREAGADIVALLVAKGGSGGRVAQPLYDEVKAEFMTRLADAGELDGIYLALHGAMATEALGDPEGDLLSSIRELVGPQVPIAVSLDLHAHVSPEMAASANIIVGYETYPHEDAYETGRKAAGLLVRTVRGEINPIMALRRIDALVPVLGGSTDDGHPMAEVKAIARAMERDQALLSVSYFPVQPWLDYPRVGIAGVAISDGDAGLARDAATRTVTAMWDRRLDFNIECYLAADAVQKALQLDADTVLVVDASDSIGGGASGDSPALLKALLNYAADVDSAICIVDPSASRAAHEAGLGVAFEGRIGASADTRFHDAASVRGVVESLHQGDFVYEGGPAGGARASLGPTAVIRSGGVRIVVATHPVYEFMDEHYRACGIDITQMKIVSFKNLMNFRKLIGPGVAWLALDEAGSTPLKLENVEWENKHRPFWPCDDFVQPPFME